MPATATPDETTRAAVTRLVETGGEIANLGEFHGLVVQVDHLLGSAYKALIAVEQLRPAIGRLSSRCEETFDHFDGEERERVKQFSALLADLGSDNADIQIHEAWRLATTLGDQLSEHVGGAIEEFAYVAERGLCREQVPADNG